MTSIHKLTRQIKKLSTFLVLVVSYHCLLVLYMYVSRKDRSFTEFVIQGTSGQLSIGLRASMSRFFVCKGLSYREVLPVFSYICRHKSLSTQVFLTQFTCLHSDVACTQTHNDTKGLSDFPQGLQDRESFRGCFKCTTVPRPSDKEEFLIPGRSPSVYEQDFCILIGRFS